MSDAVIFKDLPATFPERDKFKKPSVISSVIFHVLLIVMVGHLHSYGHVMPIALASRCSSASMRARSDASS